MVAQQQIDPALIRTGHYDFSFMISGIMKNCIYWGEEENDDFKAVIKEITMSKVIQVEFVFQDSWSDCRKAFMLVLEGCVASWGTEYDIMSCVLMWLMDLASILMRMIIMNAMHLRGIYLCWESGLKTICHTHGWYTSLQRTHTDNGDVPCLWQTKRTSEDINWKLHIEKRHKVAIPRW